MQSTFCFNLKVSIETCVRVCVCFVASGILKLFVCFSASSSAVYYAHIDFSHPPLSVFSLN